MKSIQDIKEYLKDHRKEITIATVSAVVASAATYAVARDTTDHWVSVGPTPDGKGLRIKYRSGRILDDPNWITTYGKL